MRIGLQIPSFTWSGGTREIGMRLAEIGRTADEVGFASLWVMDHFFQIERIGPLEDPMLESYSTLSYLAGITKQVQLGALVTGVIYRPPAILVKTVTTLDVLSRGRASFGLGASWYEREAHGLGIPYPSLKERFERLEETLQITHHMWSDNAQPFQGTYYQLAEPLNHPQPIAHPHPPIMIGGGGEQKTLRLVAQYADACNLFARMGVEAIRQKLDILRDHCEAVGRSYDEIERTALASVHLAPGAMTVEEVIGQCRALADVGIQQVIFNMPNVQDITPLEVFGREIIPIVAAF